MEEQPKVNTKVKDLTPTSKQVNLLAKVVALGEQKEITPRYGSPRRLVEATIGDETGTVILTLWEDQINAVAKDDVVQIDNGFVSLVRGHVRLNVGKYGTLAKSDQEIPDVNTALDVSAQEHEQERRASRFDSPRSESRGGFAFGTDDRDFSRDRSKDRRGGDRRRY
jgi:replication factor A1